LLSIVSEIDFWIRVLGVDPKKTGYALKPV
jgi:hypothetical protein